MDNLWQKVINAQPHLSECKWEECGDRGEYIRCYLDIYKLCPKYLTHKHYVRTVREMRDAHKNK